MVWYQLAGKIGENKYVAGYAGSRGSKCEVKSATLLRRRYTMSGTDGLILRGCVVLAAYGTTRGLGDVRF